MNKNIFQRRIPTLLALFILLLGLALSSFLVQQKVFYIGRAGPNEEPQNIQITNITQDSFTVAFTTLDKTIAGVSIINTDLPEVFFDSRNPEEVNKPYSTHLVTVKNLKPDTQYEFNILSNSTVYLNNGENFTAKTAGGKVITSNLFIITGKVLLPDGTNASDVLVNAIISNAAPITAVTDEKGEYSIPANLIRNKSSQNLLDLPPGTQIILNASNGKLSSDVRFVYVPGIDIPTVTLSNSYSFIAEVDESPNVSTPSSELTIPSSTKQPDVKISIPRNDQTFTDTKPKFQGIAFPNRIVKINIGPNNEISANVRSDPNGNWSYRPAVSLSSGNHSISISSVDTFGLTRSVSKSFNIFPSGSQIAESATPSATPTTQAPTATPTPTSIITPSVGATPTPTLRPITPTPTIMVPTPTPTQIVLQPTPTPTFFVANPPQKQIPPTGPEFLPIILTSVSLLFIVAGSALLFIL